MIELLREELLKEKQIDTTIGTVIPTESKLQETKHLHRVLDGVRKFKEYFEDDKEKLKEDLAVKKTFCSMVRMVLN